MIKPSQLNKARIARKSENFFRRKSQAVRPRFHSAGPRDVRDGRCSMIGYRRLAAGRTRGRGRSRWRRRRRRPLGVVALKNYPRALFNPTCQSEVETCCACGRAVWRAPSSSYVDDILGGECAMKHVIDVMADAYRVDADVAYWPNVYGSTPVKG